MDEITKGWIDIPSNRHPQFAVSVSHQFLSGTNRNEAGFVPNDWNGSSIEYNSLPKEKVNEHSNSNFAML